MLCNSKQLTRNASNTDGAHHHDALPAVIKLLFIGKYGIEVYGVMTLSGGLFPLLHIGTLFFFLLAREAHSNSKASNLPSSGNG